MKEEFCLSKEALEQIISLIEQEFGPNCEVVLHDLSRQYAHTIVDIRNGHVTGRKVGDCGSNFGLEVIRGAEKSGDKFNYFTTTRDGKILRSSSIYLRDREGHVRYSLCVNLDITEMVKFENHLKQVNQYELPEDAFSEEILVNDIRDLLSSLLEHAVEYVGKSPEEMSREDRLRFIDYLDKKGALLISKSGERICETLGISKCTYYHLLDACRKNSSSIASQKREA